MDIYKMPQGNFFLSHSLCQFFFCLLSLNTWCGVVCCDVGEREDFCHFFSEFIVLNGTDYSHFVDIIVRSKVFPTKIIILKFSRQKVHNLELLPTKNYITSILFPKNS